MLNQSYYRLMVFNQTFLYFFPYEFSDFSVRYHFEI